MNTGIPPLPLSHRPACRLLGRSRSLIATSTATIHVTGASGWFGRCTLEALLSELGPSAFRDRVRPYTSAGGTIALRDGAMVPTLRFDQLTAGTGEHGMLLHYAYLTKERTASMSLQAYLDANRQITRTVLASLQPLGCTAVFMPSSGAVYRPAVALDELTPANAYGKLKLEDEDLLRGWATAAPGRTLSICRVFNVSGPYINKYSDYALSSIIDATLQGRRVQIRTPKHTLRSFVAIDEVVSLALGLLCEPAQVVSVFDTAGEQELEIDDLAREIGRSLELPVVLERPPRSDEQDRYIGERALYASLLERFGIDPVSIRDQILQTASYVQQFPGR